jgi:PAS domain S-box-containing protein
MDQKGLIRFVNRQTEGLFGYERDELIGRPIETLVPESLYEIYAEHREDYFTDPRTRSSGLDLEVTGRHRDGTELLVNISMSHIDTGDVLLVITAVRDVTKQKRAVQTAQLTAAIVEYSNDAIIGATLEGTITSWNSAAERMYGYSSNEIIGRSGSVLATEAQAGEMTAALAGIRDGQPVEHVETNRVRKDGTVFPVSISVAPIRDEDGTIVGASSIARDVTDQRQAFEAAQRMAAIVESSDDAIFGSTLDGTITSWNPAAERMFGYTAQEMIGMSGRLLSPEDRVDEIKTTLAKVRAGQHIEHLETVRVCKDGTLFPASLTISPIRGAEGAVVGASAISRNMTELRHAARYTRGLIEAGLDPLMTISPQGTINDVNKATVTITGVARDELIGSEFSQYFTEPDKAREGYQQAFTQGSVTDYPLTVRHKNGTLTDLLCNALVYRDINGAVLGVLATGHDVSRQKKAFETAQRLAAIVESSTDAIISRSLEGIITSWNPAAERIFGYSSQEIIGRDASVLIPQGRPDEVDAIPAKIEAGLPVEHLEVTRVRKDGTEFPVSLTTSPIRDADGAIVGISTINRDMTDQVLALEAAQRMAAIVRDSGDAILSGSLDGIITSWNPTAEVMFGYSSQEIIGQPADILLPEDQEGEVTAVLAKLRAGQHVESLETMRVRKDGSVFPISLTASPIRAADGAVVGASVIYRDMSRQRLALEAAQRSAAIVEFSRDAIISGTLDGIITSWNPAAEALYGYSGEEIVGKSIRLLVPRNRSGDIAAILDGINEGKAVEDFETMRVRWDGTEFPVSLTISPIRDPGGAIVGTCSIHHDMTAHVLRLQAAQRIAAIVEGSEDAIVGSTTDGIVTSWNSAAERMFGHLSEEIVGKSVTLLARDEEIGQLKANLARIVAGRAVERQEVISRRKDGTVFPVLRSLSPIHGLDGGVVGISAICRDMTEQEHAALYARSLIEASMDPMMMVGPDGTINDLNEAAVKITGVSREELIGTDFAQCVTEPDKAGEVFQRMLVQGWVANVPLTVRHLNGTLTSALCNATAYRDSEGRVLGMLAVARDVTEHA